MTKDSVCGVTVDEATDLHVERDGQTFFFCSESCRKKCLSTLDGVVGQAIEKNQQ